MWMAENQLLVTAQFRRSVCQSVLNSYQYNYWVLRQSSVPSFVGRKPSSNSAWFWSPRRWSYIIGLTLICPLKKWPSSIATSLSLDIDGRITTVCNMTNDEFLMQMAIFLSSSHLLQWSSAVMRLRDSLYSLVNHLANTPVLKLSFVLRYTYVYVTRNKKSADHGNDVEVGYSISQTTVGHSRYEMVQSFVEVSHSVVSIPG